MRKDHGILCSLAFMEFKYCFPLPTNIIALYSTKRNKVGIYISFMLIF